MNIRDVNYHIKRKVLAPRFTCVGMVNDVRPKN